MISEKAVEAAAKIIDPYFDMKCSIPDCRECERRKNAAIQTAQAVFAVAAHTLHDGPSPEPGSLTDKATAWDAVAEKNAAIARLNKALNDLLSAAKNMPLWTPTGGGASTKHTYQIAASEVWALDKAVSEAVLVAEDHAGGE